MTAGQVSIALCSELPETQAGRDALLSTINFYSSATPATTPAITPNTSLTAPVAPGAAPVETLEMFVEFLEDDDDVLAEGVPVTPGVVSLGNVVILARSDWIVEEAAEDEDASEGAEVILGLSAVQLVVPDSVTAAEVCPAAAPVAFAKFGRKLGVTVSVPV